MSDPTRDILGEDRFAASGLRMAALSLLLEQTLHGAHPDGRAAAARERGGHDLTSLLDGAFGGRGEHAPPGVGGLVAGLAGLVHVLRQHGLGREVESWIGSGPNLPVTAGQVAPVFGAAAVERHARDAGSDRESLLREVAALLPAFVHGMTPQGRLPADAAEAARVAPGGMRGLFG